QITHRERLRMSAVTPVRVEIAQSAIFSSSLCRMTQISERSVVSADQTHPRGGPGADIERQFGFRERAGFAIERMILFVAPIEGNHVFWQLPDQFRIMQNDIAPKLHAPVLRRIFAINFIEEL